MCKIYGTLEGEKFTLTNFPIHAELYNYGVVLSRRSVIGGHALEEDIETLTVIYEARANFRIVTSKLMVALHLPVLTDPEYESIEGHIPTSDDSLSIRETLKLIYDLNRCVSFEPALVPVIQGQLHDSCRDTPLN